MVTGNIVDVVIFKSGVTSVFEFMTSLVHNFVFEKPWRIVEKAVNNNGYDENPCFHVVLLDKKWQPDGQKTLNCYGNGSIARSRQAYL